MLQIFLGIGSPELRKYGVGVSLGRDHVVGACWCYRPWCIVLIASSVADVSQQPALNGGRVPSSLWEAGSLVCAASANS